MIKTPTKTQTTFELAKIAIDLGFKYGMTIGGGAILFYCFSIGHIPQGVTVGDALLFLLIAIQFCFVYSLFVFGLISAGLSTRPLWDFGGKFISLWFSTAKKLGLSKKGIVITRLPKPALENYIAFIAFSPAIYYFGSQSWEGAILTVTCVYMSAGLWASLIGTNRITEEVTALDHSSNELNKIAASANRIKAVSFVSLLIIPIILMEQPRHLVEQVMEFANVRVHNVDAHIQAPYAEIVKSYCADYSDSAMGHEYTKFENLMILFRGLGQDVVLESHCPPVILRQFSVPDSHLYLVNRPQEQLLKESK